MNPQLSVLETDALPIELLACVLSNLTGLFMQCMMTAPFAILLILDAVRVVLLILGGRIITPLAIGASQCYLGAH